MTDIVKVKQGGTQGFPQTHWNAVEGKPEVLKGEKGDPGPQGPKGNNDRRCNLNKKWLDV